VKTELLEWSTRLESEGIVGQGVSFSETEKQKAAKGEERFTPQVIINIIKEMTNSQIQQHSPHAGQTN